MNKTEEKSLVKDNEPEAISKGKSLNSIKKPILTKRMKDFIIIFKKNAGRIYVSCDKAKIDPKTYWNWFNKNDKFKGAVEIANEELKDWVDGKIIKHIDSKDEKIAADMAKFYAKNKMKDRGYFERTELNQHIRSHKKIKLEIIEVIKNEDEYGDGDEYASGERDRDAVYDSFQED